MYITVHKMQYITKSFSLNREMQQVARDITPPLPSLESTSSMMESASSKTSGKQFYIYFDF